MSTAEYRLALDKENYDKGIGLYARRPYHKSELIFTEKPLIRVPYKSSQPFMKQLWRHVANDISSHPVVDAFKNMNRYDQKDFLRLHNSRKRFLTRADPCPPNVKVGRKISGPTCAFELLGIYLTNLLFLHEDLTGVFKNISRINHACAANAYLAWDRTNGEMRVVAASNILSAGAEITIDYSEKFVKLGIFMVLENIREHCRYFYGFWCQCKFCRTSISKGSVQEISSEQERNMISFHLDELEQKLLFKQEAPCWEIREFLSRDSPTSSIGTQSIGQVGMFATRRISKGEPIVGETPMFVLELHQDQLKGATYIPSVMTAVQNLDQEERAAYLALTKRDPSVSGLSFDCNHAELEINQLKEIFVSNAICLPSCCQKEGYCEWGVFQHISRVNHSCIPNAVGMTYNRKLRGTGQCQHWLHARRDIECGEEITICYVEALCTEESVAVRTNTLKDRFVCWCLRCTHDRQGSSWVQNIPLTSAIDYKNENPSEYPKAWVERVSASPATGSNQPTYKLRPRKGKNKSILPSLVSNDLLIELNKIPKKRKIFVSAKRTGRKVVNRINSLPFVVENVKQNISNVRKGKKKQEQRGEVLQRRIKFPESSEFGGGGEHRTMRQALEYGPKMQPRDIKGKQRGNNEPLPTEWSTMSAIIVRQDSEVETNWGSGGTTHPSRKPKAAGWDLNLSLRPVRAEPFIIREDNQSLGSNGHLDPTLDVPASTSTELWESSGGINKSPVEIPPKKLGSPSFRGVIESPSSSSISPKRKSSMSNQGLGTIPFIHHGDHDLSDQYYMSRLGVEPVTAERLERANSLSLKSPVDGEPMSEKPGAPQPLAMKSENNGCSNSIQKNAVSDPRSNLAYLTEYQGEQREAFINQLCGAFNNNADGETPGSDRYLPLTGIEYSVTNRDPSAGSRRITRNMPTSATSSSGMAIRQPASTANEGSISSGDLSLLSQEAASPTIVGQEHYRATSYRTLDGKFSINRSDQDRRSGSNGFEVLGKHVCPAPSAPRATSAGLLGANNSVQYYPEHKRGSSSESSSTYTYGVAERSAAQRIQSHERIWSGGNAYRFVGGQATTRLHQYEKQPTAGSLSDGVGRDTKGKTQEYNRLPSSGQESRPGGTGYNGRRPEYQRQKFRSEFSSSIEREKLTGDPKYRRSQSMAESFRAAPINSGTQYRIMGRSQVREAASSGGEGLAQRTRKLPDRARDSLPQPPSASGRLIEVDTSMVENTKLRLDSTEREIEYPSTLSAVDNEGVYQAAAIGTPKREITKSLHWLEVEFPDGYCPQNPASERQATGIGFVGGVKSPLGGNDQSENNQTTFPGQMHKEYIGQSDLDRLLAQPEDVKSSKHIKAPFHNRMTQSSPKTGGSSNGSRQLLSENDNPCLPTASLARLTANGLAEENIKSAAAAE